MKKKIVRRPPRTNSNRRYELWLLPKQLELIVIALRGLPRSTEAKEKYKVKLIEDIKRQLTLETIEDYIEVMQS